MAHRSRTDGFRPMMAGLVALLLAVVAAASTRAEAVRVDFGPEDSPVRPGFVLVTDKSRLADDTVVGWLDPAGLVARNNPVPREWQMNPSRGVEAPPPIYTTDLRQDCVQAASAAVLRLRVPDGDYRVWLLCGSAGGDRNQVWNIRLEDGGPEATFAGGEACRVLVFDRKAAGGRLDLRLATASRWVVNAMIAAPVAEWIALRAAEIAKIEQEIYLLPDDVLAKWRHTPRVETRRMPAFTAEEKARGFVIYHRHWMTPIWPNTAPEREEIGPTLRAFASRDEYEPLTFTILPLRDFESVSVEVSDLKTADGKVIRRDSVDARYVRYMYVRPNYSMYGTYYRAPDVLMPFRGPQPLVKDENFRVWLTVYVDAFAPGGVYKGQATVTAHPGGGEAAATAQVPIVFRVAPIRLLKDQSIAYGIYYRHPYDSMVTAPDAFSRGWWRRKAEAEFADMAAHGNNAFVSGVGGRMDEKGRWIIDFEPLQAKIDMARRYGFDKPLICSIPTGYLYRHHMKGDMGSHLRLLKSPPPEFYRDLTEMVRAIEAGRRQRQWPELLYYPVDEPATSEVSVKFMTEVMKAIKQVPGARTYVTADPVHEEFAPMKPYVDVWCCQPFSLSRETILKDMKERGVEYWCYPNHVNGENDHTTVAGARMTYGFGFWRSGFRALTPWIYQSIGSDPWNYLDSPYMDFFNRTDDDATPIPVTMWEAYREGIDDGRYVTTLQRWAERARQAGLAAYADEAEADLKFVWDSIQVMPKYKYDTGWDAEVFDVYRWMLAGRIMKLQEAVTGTRP